MPWFYQPPSILAHLVSLAETTHTDIYNFEVDIEVLLTALVNTVDNMVITPDSLQWRFIAGEEIKNMSDHLPYWGAFGIAFVGTYLFLEWRERRRQRNTLGGQLEREKKRLKELHDYLSEHMAELNPAPANIPVNTLLGKDDKTFVLGKDDFETFVKGLSNDYDRAQLKLFKKIAEALVEYHKKLHPWRIVFQKNPKKLKKI